MSSTRATVPDPVKNTNDSENNNMDGPADNDSSWMESFDILADTLLDVPSTEMLSNEK